MAQTRTMAPVTASRGVERGAFYLREHPCPPRGAPLGDPVHGQAAASKQLRLLA